jgi:hypothetical protein
VLGTVLHFEGNQLAAHFGDEIDLVNAFAAPKAAAFSRMALPLSITAGARPESAR